MTALLIDETTAADLADDARNLVDAPEWAGQIASDPDGGASGMSDMDTPYRLSDDAEADWAMRKLRQAEARMTSRQAQATRQIEAVTEAMDTWLEGADAADTGTATFFRDRLADYMLAARRADSKCKSIQLPTGILTTRERPAAAILADRDVLAGWARTHVPELVEQVVTWKPDTAGIKALAEVRDGRVAIVNHTTGTVTPVQGLDVRPASVDVTVEVTA